MMRSLLTILTVGALIAAAPAADEQTEKDQKALQGSWIVLTSEAYGEDSPAEEKEKLRVIFDNDMVRLKGAREQDDLASYTLDASKSPKQIDATIKEGESAGQTVKGIYKIEDGKVTMCWSMPGGERPSEFKTETGSETRMFVLKKVGEKD